ncbi:MAG: polyphenol oxidase family protein [Deltaproteobacteria bacterium]|jgi:YfiH family protein|nr:polyphenol oxidase family protein [Deltaproteobacteria bacterium]
MLKKTIGSLEYYAFANLDKFSFLRQAVLTRRSPAGRDWTLAFGETADPAEVAENIREASRILGLSYPAFVRQVHGPKILFLEPGDVYQPQTPEETKQGYDAIVAGGGQSLLIKLADCQGIIVLDPASRALALIHNGWRGSVQNIVGLTVRAMAEKFSSAPSGFLAAVSPSLGPCCAEFKDYKTLLPESFLAFKDDRNHFDFPAITRKQLTEAGIPAENIESADVCTRCSPEFYSHRRGEAGRFAVLAGIV